MKKADKIGINIVDATTIDFSVLSDVVYTLRSIEFSSDEKIKSIHIDLEIDNGRIQFALNTLSHNEWGGVSPKRVCYFNCSDDIDEGIDILVEEYERWFKLEDRMSPPRIKMPMIIKDGKLADPISEIVREFSNKIKNTTGKEIL